MRIVAGLLIAQSLAAVAIARVRAPCLTCG
jgi:hypothetical protein